MSIDQNTPPLPEGECNCTPPHDACSICQGKKAITWRLKVNDNPEPKTEQELRCDLEIARTEIEVLKQDNAKQQQIIREIDKQLGKPYGAERYLQMSKRCGEKDIELKRLDSVIENYQDSCKELKEEVERLRFERKFLWYVGIMDGCHGGQNYELEDFEKYSDIIFEHIQELKAQQKEGV